MSFSTKVKILENLLLEKYQVLEMTSCLSV